MILHKDCTEISVFDFYMMMFKKDFRYLIKNLDECSEKQINGYISKNKEKLSIRFSLIYSEYRSLMFSKKELNKEKAHSMLIITQSTHKIASEILRIYKDTGEVKVLGLLNELERYSFDLEGDIGRQLDKAIKWTKGLDDKIGVMKMNYTKKYIKDDGKIDEDYRNIIKNLDKQALSLSAYLELGYSIDIKKTSLVRWININELAEAKIIRNG